MTAYIADFTDFIFYILYIFLIFSVHCHSGKFKTDRGGTLGDSVYAVYVSILFFLLPFCGEIKLCISSLFCLSVTVVNNNEPCTLFVDC